MRRALPICFLLLLCTPNIAAATTACQTFNGDQVWGSDTSVADTPSNACWVIPSGVTLTIKAGVTVTVGNVPGGSAILEVQDGGKLIIEQGVSFRIEQLASDALIRLLGGTLDVQGTPAAKVTIDLLQTTTTQLGVIDISDAGQLADVSLKHLRIVGETQPANTVGVSIDSMGAPTLDTIQVHGPAVALSLHNRSADSWSIGHADLDNSGSVDALVNLADGKFEITDSVLSAGQFALSAVVIDSGHLVTFRGNKVQGGQFQLKNLPAGKVSLITGNIFAEFGTRSVELLSDGVSVTNNLFFSNTAPAVQILGLNAVIAFNTISCVVPSPGAAAIEAKTSPGAMIVANLVNGQFRGISHDLTLNPPQLLMYNNVSLSTCPYDAPAANCAAPNSNGNTGNTTLDPQLDANFGLLPTSPLIDSVPFSAVYGLVDAGGNPRDLNLGNVPKNNLDVGAFETPTPAVVTLDLPVGPNAKMIARGTSVAMTFEGRNLAASTTVTVVDAGTSNDDALTVVVTENATVGSGTTFTGLNTLLSDLVVTAQATAPLGWRHLDVRNAADARPYRLENAFYVVRGTKLEPTTPLLPTVGEQGEDFDLTIHGSNFPTDVNLISVTLGAGNGQDGVYTEVLEVNANGTEIKLHVYLEPDAVLGGKTLVITNTDTGFVTELDDAFTVHTHPVITSVSPSSAVKSNTGTQKYEVKIKGSGFVPSGLVVKICSDAFNTKTTIIAAVETQILVEFELQSGSLTGDCFPSVINADGGNDTAAEAFKVLPNTPPAPPQVTGPQPNTNGVIESTDGAITLQTPSDSTPLPQGETTVSCSYSLDGQEVTSVVATNGVCQPDTSKLVDNTNYLVTVTITDPGGAASESTLTLFYNPTNNPPGIPVPQSPIAGAVVTTLTPTVTFLAALDGDQDRLTYDVEVARDGDSLPVVELTGLAEKSTALQAALIATLEENTTYHWRVRAVDEHGLAGEWSVPQTFRIDVTNESPSVPTLISPVNGVAVRNSEVGFVFANLGDVDGDPLTIDLQLSTDGSFDESKTMTVFGIDDYQPSVADSYVLYRKDLVENTRYYWRIRVYDSDVASDWSATGEFVFSVINDGPTPPTRVSPLGNTVLTTSHPQFEVTNDARDLEQDRFTYEIEIYRQGDLPPITTSALSYRAALAPIHVIQGIPVSSAGTTLHRFSGALPSGDYAWRIRSVDNLGQAGDWSPYGTFRIKLEIESLAGGHVGCRASLAAPSRSAWWFGLLLLALLALRRVVRRDDAV